MKTKHLLLTFFGILNLLSTQAQQAWHIQNSGFSTPLRGISSFSVVDSNVIWAVAYDGSANDAPIREYTVTTNGGATWVPDDLVASGVTSSYSIANISAIDKDTAYASVFPTGSSAFAQGIYKTINGGSSWTKVSTDAFVGSFSFINAVHMFDAQHGVALGDPSDGFFEVYTTDNYAQTWVRVPQSDIDITPLNDGPDGEYGTVGFYSAKENSIWYPTNFGRILISNDRGLTWKVGDNPYDSVVNDVAIPSISFKDEMNGMAIVLGDGLDAIIKTTDGGQIWTTLRDTSSGGVYARNAIAYVPGTTDTWFVTSAHVFPLVNTGGMGSAYSEDGGQNWSNIDKIQHTIALAFSSINNGWSGGFNETSMEGGIFKWGTERQTTGVSSKKGTTNLFSIYPNPNQGVFYLNAKVSGKSTLNVYDMTGKLVLTKNYETLNLLLTQVDLSGFSKGLYMVELINNNNRSSERVLVE